MPEFSDKSEELTQKPKELKPVEELAPQPEDTGVVEPQSVNEIVQEAEDKQEIKLSPPSKEMAAKMLAEVGFKDRLEGTKMAAMAGDIRESLYSFKEAVKFLHFNVGSWTDRGIGSIGYINPVELEKWIRNVFGDLELAEAIGTEIKVNINYKDQARAIMPLMQQRLRQCEEIAGEETKA